MPLNGLRAGACAWCRVAFLFLVCFMMPESLVHAAPLAAPPNATTATWTDNNNILTAAPTTTAAPPTPSGSTPTAAPFLPANGSATTAPSPYATLPNVSAAPTGSPSNGGSSDMNSVIFAILGIVVGQIVGFVLIALMRHYYHLRRGSCGVPVASVSPDMDSNGHARLVLMGPEQQQQQQRQQQRQLADAPSGADGNGLRSTKEAPVDGGDDPRGATGPAVPNGATSDVTRERHGALVALASPLVQRFEPMDSSMRDSP